MSKPAITIFVYGTIRNPDNVEKLNYLNAIAEQKVVQHLAESKISPGAP